MGMDWARFEPVWVQVPRESGAFRNEKVGNPPEESHFPRRATEGRPSQKAKLPHTTCAACEFVLSMYVGTNIDFGAGEDVSFDTPPPPGFLMLARLNPVPARGAKPDEIVVDNGPGRPARPSTSGRTSAASSCIPSRLASPCRTAASRASTAAQLAGRRDARGVQRLRGRHGGIVWARCLRIRHEVAVRKGPESASP